MRSSGGAGGCFCLHYSAPGLHAHIDLTCPLVPGRSLPRPGSIHFAPELPPAQRPTKSHRVVSGGAATIGAAGVEVLQMSQEMQSTIQPLVPYLDTCAGC